MNTTPAQPDAPAREPRLCVMISGSGRTLEHLAGRIASGALRAQIALVIASGMCAGCERARRAGVEPEILPGRIGREDLARVLQEHRIDWVVLAGYLKLLSVPERWRGRVVNIHPALLPSFGGPGMYGHRVHEAVLAHGCKISGCTVHLVDDEYDNGAIVAQSCVPVLEGDTPGTLAARVFEAELELYPRALSLLLAGRVRVEGRRAVVGGGGDQG